MRTTRGIAHEVQSSGHLDGADMTAAAHAYDENLLACELDGDGRHGFSIIMHSKDRPFADYAEALRGSHESFTINCKTFTEPPKPAATLGSLNSHALPQDVIGVIASFNHDVHCKRCRRISFNMTYLERCRTALALNQWVRVHREVKEEGGSCDEASLVSGIENQTLRTCMGSPQADQVVFCIMETASADIIKEIESRIEEKLEDIKGLQHDLDMQKQNIAYLKQIFHGHPQL